MKRTMLIVLIVMIIALVAVFPAFADHSTGPCTDSGGPGNSDYGRHHISSFAKDGNLGNEGHKPGVSHQGFSVCDPSG